MSNPIPIRPGQGSSVQPAQPNSSLEPEKELPDQKELGDKTFAQDKFIPAKRVGPSTAQALGAQLLTRSVSDAIQFLSNRPATDSISIAGVPITAGEFVKTLSAIAQQGGGSATVAEALAAVGQEIMQQMPADAPAQSIPIQNASVRQALEGLKQLPPDQAVLSTNAPGGGTQAITAGNLTRILNQVNQQLGASTDHMTVAQALQYFAQAAQKK